MEKKFLLCDIEVTGQIAQKITDNEIVKCLPFCKRDTSVPNKTLYNYVLIPYENYYNTEYIDDSFTNEELEEHVLDPMNKLNNIIKKELCKILYPLKENKFYVRPIITDLDFSNFAISYTDGSKTQKTDQSGWGVVKLKEVQSQEDEIMNENYLTYSDFSYDCFYGGTDNGTNNIGELTAVKFAVQNADNKPLNIIISDNIYAIKTYREYIHTWKKNGYVGSNKKEIKNKELIKETQKSIEDANCTFLYCWAKGHKGINFNEMADKLAKTVTGGDE